VPDVLLVGSGGQLGFELLRAEWPRGLRVVGLSRAELDLTDAANVRHVLACSRPEIVVNAAAYTAVDRAEQEPELAFAVNRDGARHLAERAPALVHVSTDYVFDGKKDGAYLETDAARPLGVYGASKLAGEEAVRATLARHVIVRTAWLFGVQGANFVKTMIRLAAERERVGVVHDQRGCPTPAAELARAIVRIVERIANRSASFGTFHYAGAPATTWHGFAREIFEMLRARGRRVPELQPIATEEYPVPARRAQNSELACGAILAAYGIQQPSWAAGLSAVIDELSGSRPG
jgi:dTDP-4-dehydrorhamnose reductase